MGIKINMSEDGYITYTITCENVTWTVDEDGKILGEAITDREYERERTLI